MVWVHFQQMFILGELFLLHRNIKANAIDFKWGVGELKI